MCGAHLDERVVRTLRLQLRLLRLGQRLEPLALRVLQHLAHLHGECKCGARAGGVAWRGCGWGNGSAADLGDLGNALPGTPPGVGGGSPAPAAAAAPARRRRRCCRFRCRCCRCWWMSLLWRWPRRRTRRRVRRCRCCCCCCSCRQRWRRWRPSSRQLRRPPSAAKGLLLRHLLHLLLLSWGWCCFGALWLWWTRAARQTPSRRWRGRRPPRARRCRRAPPSVTSPHGCGGGAAVGLCCPGGCADCCCRARPAGVRAAECWWSAATATAARYSGFARGEERVHASHVDHQASAACTAVPRHGR